MNFEIILSGITDRRVTGTGMINVIRGQAFELVNHKANGMAVLAVYALVRWLN